MLRLIQQDTNQAYVSRFAGRPTDAFINTVNGVKRPGVWNRGYSSGKFFPMDITVEDDNVIVRAELPGVKVDTIRLEIEENILRIKTSMNEFEEDENPPKYILKERQCGSKSRMIRLPHNIDHAASCSSYRNGILEIVLPKTIDSKVRQIPVN